MSAQEYHGETRGGKASPEYRTYREMLRRCADPRRGNYVRYGGRGIRVCARWQRSFAAFLADVGRKPTPTHSLDRRNNSKGYTPGNVIWATAQEQQRNTRRNRYITFRGTRRSLAAWVEALGLDYDVIKQRLRLGWSPAAALTTQTRACKRLTAAERVLLHKLYAKGAHRQHELAKMFNVTQSSISRALQRVKKAVS